MTITAVNEMGITGSIEADGIRSYDVSYLVESDSRNDTVVQVASALPAHYSTLAFKGTVDEGVQLKRYNVSYLQERESTKVWKAICQYDNRPLSGGGGSGSIAPGQQIDDPTLWQPKIWGSFVGQVVEIERDYQGKPVRNPLGDKFRNAYRTKAQPELNIEKTYFSINLVTIGNALDKVNAVQFFGGDVGTFLLETVEWQQVYHGLAKYYQVRYRFLYSPVGHRFRPRLEGTRYYIDTTDKEIESVRSDTGFAFGDGYVNLEADGTLRDAGLDPLFYGVLATDGSTVAPDGIIIYDSIDFISVLQLPSGF